MIIPDRYPFRNLSTGKSVVTKGIGWRLRCRCSLSQLSRWVPAGVVLADEGCTDADVLAALIRITGGNCRLLHRLLTQIARLVEINALSQVTREVVEAARESLVIGAV